MATRREKRFVFLLACWVCTVLVATAALGTFALDQFYVAALAGLVVLDRTTDEGAVTPRWRVRVRRVIVLGVVGFGAIVAWRVVRLLPEVSF